MPSTPLHQAATTMSAAEPSNQQIMDMLNGIRAPAVCTLGGEVLAFDGEARTIHMGFKAVPEFCHSRVIVQGGFITGMLDAAMAYVVIGVHGLKTRVPTLEIKVSFISPGRSGRMIATCRAVHLGKSTAFLSGELHQDNRLVATATSTAKIYLK